MRRIDFSMFHTVVKETNSAGLLIGSAALLLSEDKHLESVLKIVQQQSLVLWVSEGNWSMHELLLALLNITGPAEVYISSYAMSEQAARVLATLKNDTMITRLHCVLDNRVDIRTPGSLQLIKAVSDAFALVKTHAKVTVIKNDAWNVTVIGSANYTENARYEAGIIITTGEAADMHIRWIKKAIENA